MSNALTTSTSYTPRSIARSGLWHLLAAVLLKGLREAFGRWPFRHEGHHRHVQPFGGCLIAAEGFQRIASLAFHPAFLEHQQDLSCFLKDLLGSAQDQSSSPRTTTGRLSASPVGRAH